MNKDEFLKRWKNEDGFKEIMSRNLKALQAGLLEVKDGKLLISAKLAWTFKNQYGIDPEIFESIINKYLNEGNL